MREIETDYLVVGAGASGMAFTDTLIDHSDADVVMVDRRHAPGGHWNDAYPFVRLHLPSAYYGVASRPLGSDTIDETGPNAGSYERATGAEVCDHYQRALDEHLLASGQVRFFGMHDHEPEGDTGHRLVSRLTGDATQVSVRRRVVDATLLASSTPATHTPSFDVGAGVRLVTPDELVRVDDPGSGCTVIGAGKTAMDTCMWLLGQGVAPGNIRWLRPRDPWTINRRFWQPLSHVPRLVEGYARRLEAASEATDVRDLFHRFEASDQVMRLDPAVEPEVFRGASLSVGELERLREVDDVVRSGYVRGIASDEITCTEGVVPTDRDRLHVDCTARGLGRPDVRPVFASDRISLQWLQWGALPFSSALTAFVEATRGDDDKNRLCRPSPPLDDLADAVGAFAVTHRNMLAWRQDPEISEWLDTCRLTVTRGLREHLDDPRMQDALVRAGSVAESAVDNLDRMLEPAAVPA